MKKPLKEESLVSMISITDDLDSLIPHVINHYLKKKISRYL